jgi:hypothetical protein
MGERPLGKGVQVRLASSWLGCLRCSTGVKPVLLVLRDVLDNVLLVPSLLGNEGPWKRRLLARLPIDIGGGDLSLMSSIGMGQGGNLEG